MLAENNEIAKTNSILIVVVIFIMSFLSFVSDGLISIRFTLAKLQVGITAFVTHLSSFVT